jgi:hypothetical protein
MESRTAAVTVNVALLRREPMGALSDRNSRSCRPKRQEGSLKGLRNDAARGGWPRAACVFTLSSFCVACCEIFRFAEAIEPAVPEVVSSQAHWQSKRDQAA